MGTCKKCDEIFLDLEMEQGYCKSCIEKHNIELDSKIEESGWEASFYLVLVVIIGYGAFLLVDYIYDITHNTKPSKEYKIDYEKIRQEVEYREKHPKIYYIQGKKSIGCEDPNILYVAIKEVRHNGIGIVSKYNCLLLFTDANATLVNDDDPTTKQILYNNPYGNKRLLWVDEDVIKESY